MACPSRVDSGGLEHGREAPCKGVLEERCEWRRADPKPGKVRGLGILFGRRALPLILSHKRVSVKPRCRLLQLDPNRIRQEGNGVIEAREHQELDQLVGTEAARELDPERI